MSNYTVSLLGPAPWGFRLQGGKDFNMPLTISRLSEGGKAAQASVQVGDVVLSIDGVSTDGMAHLAAQNKIKACTGSLKLSLQRVSPAPKPTATTVQKDESRERSPPVASIAPLAPKSTPPASSAYNKTARPFGATASSRVSPAPLSPASSPLTSPPSQAPTLRHSPAPISASPQHVHGSVGTNGHSPPVTAAKSAVTPSVNVPWQPKVYNTPINLYSSDNACEVAEGQKRGLREGQSDAKQQNGSPRRILSSAYSDVQHHHQLSDQSKKRLMQDTEDWQPKTGTAQSRSFSILAQMTGTEHMEPPANETSKKTSALENTEPTKTVGTSTTAIPDECGAHSPRARSVITQTDGAPASLVPDLGVTVAELDTTTQRFIEGVEEKVPTMPSDVPHSPPNATGGSPHSVDSVKRSVAVQTCDILAFDDASPAPTSVGAADPITSLPPASRRTIFRNPLEALPKTVLSFPAGKQSPKVKNAAATITAVLTAQASGEHSEVLQPIGPARASVKPISKPGGVCRTSPAAAASGPAFKPSGASGAAKTTIWHPGNSAVNSFSKATLPTANVAPANSTPNSKVPSTAMNKPPVQDDDTLVQMAEHIPAGNRTPMCAHCNLVIRGPFLVAMGRSWHPEEFTCAYCSLTLAHIGFVEENGSVYCEKCYEQFFAPECARCQRKILGEIINALKQTWHVNCFVCVACMQPIRNNVFHMEGGDPYCEKDYYNLFGTNCHGCDFPIEAGDKFLQALDHTWHDTCFVCAVCCANLEGQTFFSKKDKLLCKKHAHTVNV